MNDRERAMRRAAELGIAFVEALPERHVGALTDAASLAAELGGPLPDAVRVRRGHRHDSIGVVRKYL